MGILELNWFEIFMGWMVRCPRATNGIWHWKRESNHLLPSFVNRHMGKLGVTLLLNHIYTYIKIVISCCYLIDSFPLFIIICYLIFRVAVLILHINAFSKVSMLHLHQHMNQIQLPINIQAIQLEMKPINIMSHHFQMLVNSNKEVYLQNNSNTSVPVMSI